MSGPGASPLAYEAAEVLYVADLARMWGRSEKAIRSAAQRGVPWLPPAVSFG